MDRDAIIERAFAKQEREGLSLRQMSQQMGTAFSTLSRLKRGFDGGQTTRKTLLRLLWWLGEADIEEVEEAILSESVPARLMRMEMRLRHIETQVDRIAASLGASCPKGVFPEAQAVSSSPRATKSSAQGSK